MNPSDSVYIYIGGAYHLAFVLFHLSFWKIFKWKLALRRLDPLNRQVVQVVNIFLTLYFLIASYLCFFHASEILETSLGKSLMFCFVGFWFLRAVAQVIFFDLKKTLSLILTIIFLLGAVIYLIPAAL